MVLTCHFYTPSLPDLASQLVGECTRAVAASVGYHCLLKLGQLSKHLERRSRASLAVADPAGRAGPRPLRRFGVRRDRAHPDREGGGRSA